MEYEQIGTEISGGVLTITLNRPDRLNAWTATMGRELIAAVDEADRDDDVRAIIVTGAAVADLGIDLVRRRIRQVREQRAFTRAVL